jgi:hypothetical protein
MVQKKSPVESDSGLPTKIVDDFFPKTGSTQPAIVKIAQVLRDQGVSVSHLSPAMAIIVGIMSSRLGDPVPMIITEDEGAGSLELLHTCMNLVPVESWIEMQTGKSATKDPNDYKGKTVICYEADSTKDFLSQLLRKSELLGKVYQTGQTSTASKPTGWVALTKNPNNPMLKNRYATRIHITADQQSKDARLKYLLSNPDLDSQKIRKIQSACLRALLARVKPSPVDIDFGNKIIRPDASKMQNAVPFIDSIYRMLRNITRINNCPPLSDQELKAAFLKLDLEDLVPTDAVVQNEPYKATKLDYIYFLQAFAGIFNVSNDFLSPRQQAIFEAIYNHNIAYQQKLTKHKKSSPQKMLNDFQEGFFSKGWATREDIEASFKGGGEEFSYSTLHNELQILLKFDHIRETKVPSKKNKYAYIATKPPGDNDVIETDLSKIEHPEFKKNPVEIYNFYTDEIEKV